MSEGLAAIVFILLLIPGWAVGLGALFLYLWRRVYRNRSKDSMSSDGNSLNSDFFLHMS